MLSIIFYLFIFIIVFFMQTYALQQKSKNKQRVLIYISFLMILALIGFRYNVGTDYASHIVAYESYASSSFSEIWLSDGDIGFKLISFIVSRLFGDGKIIFWIYGFAALYPLYLVNKEFDFKYLAYSMLVFNLMILPVDLNIMRQGAAMSFWLLVFYRIQNGKSIRNVLHLIIVAAFLHMSSLLMIPYLAVYFFTRKRKIKYWILATIITIIISVSLTTVFKGLLESVGFDDYNYMLIVRGSISISTGTIIYYMINYALLTLLYLVYRRGGFRANNENKMIGNSFCMVSSGTIYDIAGSVTKHLSRISYYFSIHQVILIPMLLQSISNKNTRIALKILCVFVLIGLFIYRCYFRGSYEIIPYQTWLFGGSI